MNFSFAGVEIHLDRSSNTYSQILLVVSFVDVLSWQVRKTALILAIQEEYTDVVKLLLVAGANLEIKDFVSCNVYFLHMRQEMFTSFPDCLFAVTLAFSSYLLFSFHFLSFSFVVKDNITALIQAASDGNFDVVKLLLQAGANMDAVDDVRRAFSDFYHLLLRTFIELKV